MFPPCNAISRKADFPFAARARMRDPCLQRYVSRMTRTENFLSQFFSKFFWKPLLSTFYGTLFIISRKYFSVFRSLHSAPTHRYTILDSRLLPCNAISEGRLPLCNTSSEAGALPSDKQSTQCCSIINSLITHHCIVVGDYSHLNFSKNRFEWL